MDGSISCVKNITITLHHIESSGAESDAVPTTIDMFTNTTCGTTTVIPANHTNHLLTDLTYNTAYNVTITARGETSYQSQLSGSITFTIEAQGK